VATSKENLFDFLGRTSNLGGSALALVSIGASAFIHAPSIIAVGLGVVGYTAGYLMLSQSKQSISFDALNVNKTHDEDADLKAIQENIGKLQENIDNHQNRIPQEILDESHEIFGLLEEIMPRWKELESFVEQKHTINSIITNYFPTVINNYLNLPVSYYRNAAKKQVAGEIVEQLGTLKQALEAIRDKLYSGVENDIKIQSRFLKDKFVSEESSLQL
jgi:hypothetical protein